MGFCICNKTSLLIRSWEAVEQHQSFDPVTEVVVQVSSPPNLRTQRWDGATGLRSATPQEVADYDAALVDAEAQVRIDDKLLKAMLAYLVQRLNELRTQPSTALPPLTAQDVKAGIVAIYKSL